MTDNLGGRLLRVTPAGKVTVLSTDLPSAGAWPALPGRCTSRPGRALSPPAGWKNGTIQRVDPSTGRHQPWATGLIRPNGLAFLPDGAGYVAADFSAGVYRVDPGSGASCLIAERMPLASSVEIIPDRYRHAARIYVTSLLGTLYVRTQPAGLPATPTDCG